jgi:carbon-monoxide dehydrogenase small subunit/xanthine dehydrogenase small subunit
MIMTALTLGARPTIDDVREGLAGNLCRCTGYSAIYRAVASGTRAHRKRARRRPADAARQRPPR